VQQGTSMWATVISFRPLCRSFRRALDVAASVVQLGASYHDGVVAEQLGVKVRQKPQARSRRRPAASRLAGRGRWATAGEAARASVAVVTLRAGALPALRRLRRSGTSLAANCVKRLPDSHQSVEASAERPDDCCWTAWASKASTSWRSTRIARGAMAQTGAKPVA